MPSAYFAAFGGHWPHGGHGFNGFSRLTDPATKPVLGGADIYRDHFGGYSLAHRYDPDVGLATIKTYLTNDSNPFTSAKSANLAIIPFFDIFYFSIDNPWTYSNPADDTWQGPAVELSQALRIWVSFNGSCLYGEGGSESLIYAYSQPFKAGDPWPYNMVVDTGHQYYRPGLLVDGSSYTKDGWTITKTGGAGYLYPDVERFPSYKISDTYRWLIARATNLGGPGAGGGPGFAPGTWRFRMWSGWRTADGNINIGDPFEINDSFEFEIDANSQLPPAAPVVPTNAAPVVSNVSPAPGTPLTPTDHISLRVSDDSGLFRRIILTAKFEGLAAHEVVHDGDTFAPLYTEGSTLEVDEAGNHDFDLVRRGGWPGGPTITPYAIDQQGAENA